MNTTSGPAAPLQRGRSTAASLKHGSHAHAPARRRGVIFITTLGVIVILTGLALVFAQAMRTEATASGYRLSEAQADAVEQGAENWVLAQTEAYPGDAVTITQQPAEAIPVGNGYFWVLHPDPAQDQQYKFGITDECGKLNLNTILATNPQALAATFQTTEVPQLPNMNQTVADNMVAWIAQDQDTSGAQSTAYSGLAEPYQSRYGATTPQGNALQGTGFETPEELLLVQGMTPQILYGSDLNHNGVIEPAEQAIAGTNDVMGTTTTNDTRGIFNYVTCFSQPPPASASSSTTSSGNVVNVSTLNANSLSQLQTVFTNIPSLGASAFAQAVSSLTPGRNQVLPPITSLTQFAGRLQSGGLTPTQIASLIGQVSVSNGKVPQVNVNTAPEQVLNCILAPGEAASLTGARASTDTTQAGWFGTYLQSANDINSGALDQLTTTSYQYSADIVAVSGDGRAFKRVRIVIDASGMAAGSPTPAKILYRKDLTSLGWPLDPQVRVAMRAGQPPPDVNSTTNTITY